MVPPHQFVRNEISIGIPPEMSFKVLACDVLMPCIENDSIDKTKVVFPP